MFANMAYLNVSKSWTSLIYDMVEHLDSMVEYDLVQLPTFGQISQPYQKELPPPYQQL